MHKYILKKKCADSNPYSISSFLPSLLLLLSSEKFLASKLCSHYLLLVLDGNILRFKSKDCIFEKYLYLILDINIKL
jgi:hypothetical protein